MPTRRASGATKVAGPATSTPSMATRPAAGRSRPATTRRSVDLPEPDGPTSETISPAATASDTLSSAARAPKRTDTPESETDRPEGTVEVVDGILRTSLKMLSPTDLVGQANSPARDPASRSRAYHPGMPSERADWNTWCGSAGGGAGRSIPAARARKSTRFTNGSKPTTRGASATKFDSAFTS
jgi:hypothetical protein